MSLLDKASLIVTPNSYKESKLYSVVPNTTLGDMDVVRATTATRVNSSGLIEVVPRNLLQFSEQLDNAIWTKSGVTITANSVNSPIGTLTADLVTPTISDASLRQSFLPTAVLQYNFSIWLRSSTGSNFSTTLRAWRDSPFQNISNVVINVTTEWQKFNFSFTTLDATTHVIAIGGSSTLSTGENFYSWGAQLDLGSTATEYFPTTTRLNIPRIDYTNGSCPSLLVEPQRTNLATNSDGNISTYGTAINVTNASSSFNSFTNAIQFPNTALALAYKTIVTTVQTYAISVFIKMDDNSVPILSASQTTGNFCLVIAGAVVTNNLKVESYGNNVYRLSGTATSAGINANNGVIRFDTQVLKSFKITGIQLEAASYPTSYIPTVASTVTRNADVISKTGISSLIGQTEGTMFCDVNLNSRVSFTYFTIADNLASATNYLGIAFLNNSIAFESVVSGALQANISHSNTSTGRFKIAAAYKANDFVLYINGTQIGVDTSGTIPTCSQIGLSAFNQAQALNYNSAQLYKTRLTNTELAQLTTL